VDLAVYHSVCSCNQAEELGHGAAHVMDLVHPIEVPEVLALLLVDMLVDEAPVDPD
jgi:hypothetical protein